jgi:23S rRNA (adenine-N6)-dimethyltransferase
VSGSSRRPPHGAAWGWHPLTDEWARAIVAASSVRAGDLVLDIGAGTGALTRPLLASGARVVAVELHAGRRHLLHDLASHEPRLTVVGADARDLWLPRRPFRVVSNPPYDGVSRILRRLLSPGSRMLDADLVVQRQVARRWMSAQAPGAQRWSAKYEVSIAQALPRTAFRHPPRVDSVVLRVSQRGVARMRAP